jgi:hypothetical protein
LEPFPVLTLRGEPIVPIRLDDLGQTRSIGSAETHGVA